MSHMLETRGVRPEVSQAKVKAVYPKKEFEARI